VPIPLKDLPSHPSLLRGGGRKLHARVGFRWVSRGLRGPNGERVCLEAARVSNALVTTEEGVRRWLQRLNGLPAA